MKRSGIMNAELAGRLAALGHAQTITVADVGLPVPAGIPVVDLAVVQGVPRFEQVLDALLDELVVEHHTSAEEASGTPAGTLIGHRADRMGTHSIVPHDRLKRLVADCAFVVRTGDNTPYANVILRCGVPF